MLEKNYFCRTWILIYLQLCPCWQAPHNLKRKQVFHVDVVIKTVNRKTVTHMGTWRNILKEKKRCFVCLKAGHISKNCLSKMNCYNCSKQHHVAICHFEKIESNTQVSENNTPSNSTKVILQKKKQMLILVPHRTLFYFKLSSLMLKSQLFRAKLFERNPCESGS